MILVFIFINEQFVEQRFVMITLKFIGAVVRRALMIDILKMVRRDLEFLYLPLFYQN